ncbi:MAG TPA: tetraacyldisaccharide 4'-kinase, partial [Methylomirabilota bacterium]|nr:tetraacyldisaccharide 4'-kinase [Methylomirabilota bacterium]
MTRQTGPQIEDEAPLYGWARRSLYGDGGPAGTAARVAARPVGWAWSRLAGRRLRRRRPSARLPAPAVGVGNVTVGGGGKTSLVGWLLEEGLPEGARAAVLSRGTGRIGSGVWVLRPGDDLAVERVGDEPALLARAGVWVGVARDRERAAHAVAARRRPHVFILDDALQHRQVARALDLVVFTAEDLEAPARCLPAGPLRQGPGWRPALGAWVVVGFDPRGHAFSEDTIGRAFHGWWESLPGFVGSWRDAGTVELAGWRAGREIPFAPEDGVVAFAGVAKPESVERFARTTGFPPRRIMAFPDHHRYRAADVRGLLEAHPGAAFLTTEKDAVKLDPAWFGDRPVGV